MHSYSHIYSKKETNTWEKTISIFAEFLNCLIGNTAFYSSRSFTHRQTDTLIYLHTHTPIALFTHTHRHLNIHLDFKTRRDNWIIDVLDFGHHAVYFSPRTFYSSCFCSSLIASSGNLQPFKLCQCGDSVSKDNCRRMHSTDSNCQFRKSIEMRKMLADGKTMHFQFVWSFSKK